jgi:tetratricopeptide (TPR) repeat protein
MDLANCYRLLGLSPGASLVEIKASYRRLARQYHPDAYAGDDRSARQAQETFMRLTEAYKYLLKVVPSGEPRPSYSSGARGPSRWRAPAPEVDSSSVQGSRSTAAAGAGLRPAPQVTRRDASASPPLSTDEGQLKHRSYRQLQDLLKFKRFAQATAVAEGLMQRFPDDPEIRQWQAITYQQWGRHLIAEGKLEKARSYLKKALRTDPHNRSLWREVERDFRRLEQVF